VVDEVTPEQHATLLQQQVARRDELMYRRDYEEKMTRYSIIFPVGVTAWVLSSTKVLSIPFGRGAVVGFLTIICAGAFLALFKNYRSYIRNLEWLNTVDEKLGLFHGIAKVLTKATKPKWGVWIRGGVILVTWIACTAVILFTSKPAESESAQGGQQALVGDVSKSDANGGTDSPSSVTETLMDPNSWVAAATLLLVVVAVRNLSAFSHAQKDLKTPIVIFRFREEPDRYSYRAVNAGDGPALRLCLRIGEKTPDRLRQLFERPLPSDDALPPERGDPSLQIAIAFSPKDSVLLKDPELTIIAEYEDVWKRKYRTTFTGCAHGFERLT
jgi:hypothetical protein